MVNPGFIFRGDGSEFENNYYFGRLLTNFMICNKFIIIIVSILLPSIMFMASKFIFSPFHVYLSIVKRTKYVLTTYNVLHVWSNVQESDLKHIFNIYLCCINIIQNNLIIQLYLNFILNILNYFKILLNGYEHKRNFQFVQPYAYII